MHSINLLNNKFYNSFSCEKTRFSGIVNFSNSSFLHDSVFRDSQFESETDFENVKFLTITSFSNAKFNEITDFSGAVFSELADFGNIHFKKTIVYDNVVFCEYTSFKEAQFCELASFCGSEFKGEVSFCGANFCKDITFSEAKFEGFSNFEQTRFLGNLNLISARTQYVNFSDSKFNKKLLLENFESRRINVRWHQIERSLSYSDMSYLNLIKNFKNLGFFNDADKCYYQYRRESQKRAAWSEIKKYSDILALVSYGYGVHPFRALLFGLCIMTFFAIIFWRAQAIREMPTFGYAAYYSALAFMTSGSIPWDGNWKWLGVIEGFLGWIIMALFLVTLGKNYGHLRE
jgi:hypothetical protein